MSWIITRLKALSQLGLQAIALYAWHQVGLRSGWLRWRTPPGGQPALPEQLNLSPDLLALPDRAAMQACLGREGTVSLLAEADEILSGQVRLFGAPAVPLHLKPQPPLQHWTAYELGLATDSLDRDEFKGDIKYTWEPGRFGWAIVLARAYYISQDDTYAQCFWSRLERFLEDNPPNVGPHWASAQEVALRLIALLFAYQVFSAAPSSTPQRCLRLAQALVDHAARIPPSLAYARAQHNNHLVSEALGLFTAGLALPDNPKAAAWRALGWRWLNHALQTQITPTGAYAQHSTNYHRLVLQAALWADMLARTRGQAWPEPTRTRLAAATRWLFALCDPVSGQLPNLGPNDGAWILPLTTCAFADYRPTLRAAALAFLKEKPFQAGPWDETALWLGLADAEARQQSTPPSENPEPHCLHAPDGQSWAYLRMAHFTSRPGHADQLHLDLWWKGMNLAQDPGTFRYNASPPWDNALTHTGVHNTLTINGLEQMTRAGRFLYLDWAQARLVDQTRSAGRTIQRIVGEHDGYRRLGLRHQRSVECLGQRWMILDQVLPTDTHSPTPPLSVRLHWLLPDLPWDLEAQSNEIQIRLRTDHGWVSLTIRSSDASLRPLLVRAGVPLVGKDPQQPTWGWTAPTYGYKIPSLSFSITLDAPAPLAITSEWDLASFEK